MDVLTYQTPHYQLSCAQDFRPGGLGYQQHVWQATLSTDAVVFTNQPGGYSQSSAHSERPNFWAGNKWLPRAAQHKNVLVCLHRAPADAPLPFSHAYFPRKAFDQVQENGNWVFARLGESYLALYSQKKPHWHGDDELRAEAHKNIWLCELGDEATRLAGASRSWLMVKKSLCTATHDRKSHDETDTQRITRKQR